MSEEIIINGIDVSECGFCCWKHNANELIENYCAVFNNKCICNPDCYYKQFKRLQEENEELKKANELKNGLLADLGCPTTATAKRLQLTLKEQINKLEQENEELKKQLEFSRTHKVVLDAERIKYKQALEEIREIAKSTKQDICNNCGWRNTDSCEPSEYICGELIKILTKINEVLNEKP